MLDCGRHAANDMRDFIAYHIMYYHLNTTPTDPEDTIDFNDLSEELKAKARSCSTPEEMLALAKDAGFELSDTEIEAISGGGNWCFDDCSQNVTPFLP